MAIENGIAILERRKNGDKENFKMKTMDHNNSDNAAGPFSAMLSICSSILAWVSFRDVQTFFSIGASSVAIISGVFAIRYYRKQFKNKS